MASCTLSNHTVLGDYQRPYIIAEVNSSHNGSVETAKQMIDQAKEAGCDCVKFQSWSAQSLYSRTYYDSNPIAQRIVKKFALSENELKELAAYCRQKEIDFASTPYSAAEADFLAESCGVPFLKVASMDINHIPFLEYIAGMGLPVVLSTGMADMAEIERAVDTLERAGSRNLCLLHCVSIYPAEVDTVQLNNIQGLRERFVGYPVGFSDHTVGTEVAAAAVALGAAVIEKHFTLDKSRMGMDNHMAAEPAEMRTMVNACRNVYAALGKKERIVSQAELEQRKKMRRSVIASADIPAGTVLTMEDLNVKRPGDGIAPDRMKDICGMRTVRDIVSDTLIYETDLEKA